MSNKQMTANETPITELSTSIRRFGCTVHPQPVPGHRPKTKRAVLHASHPLHSISLRQSAERHGCIPQHRSLLWLIFAVCCIIFLFETLLCLISSVITVRVDSVRLVNKTNTVYFSLEYYNKREYLWILWGDERPTFLSSIIENLVDLERSVDSAKRSANSNG